MASSHTVGYDANFSHEHNVTLLMVIINWSDIKTPNFGENANPESCTFSRISGRSILTWYLVQMLLQNNSS